MARRKRKGDDGPAGPGEWIVTFSDCMTLLLCFFVLLLTFSSFDIVELQKLAGAFPNATSYDSIFPMPRETKDSSVQTPESVADLTTKGSDAPTETPKKPVASPARLPTILDDDAYKDRKIIYIPSEWLFFGNGSVLTQQGREYLTTIGRFMSMVPTRVVVSESGPSGDAGRAGAPRLDRAWAVMRYFVEQVRLPAGRFNVTASVPAVPARLRDHRVVAVTLVAGSVY